MPDKDRATILAAFYAAPDDALFDEKTIAAVRDCSLATMQRDRWAGTGIPFIKPTPRTVRYRKSTVNNWLDRPEQMSTSSIVGATI
jgi:hypothetical protein